MKWCPTTTPTVVGSSCAWESVSTTRDRSVRKLCNVYHTGAQVFFTELVKLLESGGVFVAGDMNAHSPGTMNPNTRGDQWMQFARDHSLKLLNGCVNGDLGGSPDIPGRQRGRNDAVRAGSDHFSLEMKSVN